MDIGKSFTYVFEDEEWVSKVLIGALFTILSGILIGIPFLVGYMVELIANVRAGKEKPLPRWDNLGDKFRDGLLLVIGFLVYSLPVLIIACPLVLISMAAGDNNTTFSLLYACLSCLSGLWGIVVAILSPAIYIRFAETRELGAIFRFGDILQFTQQHLAEVIVAVLLYIVASFVAAIVGTLLCVVGLLLTGFWATLVEGHLYAQVGLPRRQTPAEATPLASA